jgi:hypothetical protein
MTLVVTEIAYFPEQKDASYILCAADKRLSDEDGVAHPDEVRKLHKIRHLGATVAFFGLSVSDEGGWEFDKWLPDYIDRDSSLTLEAFANGLLNELNNLVPPHILRRKPSGFHVTGFNERRVPEFWYIRNIRDLNGYDYANFQERYWLTEELSGEHWKEHFDAVLRDYRVPLGCWFANGQLRVHGPAWKAFDDFVHEMENRGLVDQPKSPADLERRMRWKMDAIGSFYDIVANEQLVGGGVDTFILPHDQS